MTLVSSAAAVTNALSFARQRTRFPAGMCDHVVAVENGLSYSGYPTAAAHFHMVPGRYRHDVMTTPPPGALVFWIGGSSGAGHVALSVGSGLCASTDIVVTGYVNVVRISLIRQRWGLTYVGWTDAFYGPQGVRVIDPPTPLPPTPKPPVPAEIGPDEMFMYRSTHGYAVMVEGGKQVQLDPTDANAFVGGPVFGHLGGPVPTYVQATQPQEVLYEKAWGPVIHH